MKRVTVTITVEVRDNEVGDETHLDHRGIRFLLADALGEFQHPRRHAEEYVARRYPADERYAWLDRERKVDEVEARVRLAEALRCGALAGNVVIENVIEED